MTTMQLKTILTKTQYKYWVDYFDNDMTLAEIALKYDVHMTSVCHVIKNAKKRLNAACGKAVQNG